jgi:glyoxylase-like metal-dependent hydrolase (beta-lactamase superfamily II)
MELSDPEIDSETRGNTTKLPAGAYFDRPWITMTEINIPVLDIFNDGTIRIVHCPGHISGHINLLVKTDTGSYFYLGGDACHDRRIMRKELEIGEWLVRQCRSGILHPC